MSAKRANTSRAEVPCRSATNASLARLYASSWSILTSEVPSMRQELNAAIHVKHRAMSDIILANHK